MISDIPSQAAMNIDHYLSQPDFDHVYVGEIRERLVTLRDEANDLRAELDLPPVAITAADDPPRQTGSTRSELVDRMMADETAFEIATPCFSKSDLLKRGWTTSLIDRLLGRRDWESPNPHCAGGAPMLCYRQDRVIAAEATPAFRQSCRKIRDEGVPEPE